MKKVVVLSVACVFVFLMAFSCLKFPEGELKLEFDPLAPKKPVTTPTQPPGTKPQTPAVVSDNVLIVGGVNVKVHKSGSTITAENADGDAIPVLKEGDVVSSANIPDGSPEGTTSDGFLAVVVKQDGSGYAAGLIKYSREVANNDSSLGSWVDESGASVVVGITMGKDRGGTVEDGKIYIGDANKKVTVNGGDYIVDKVPGWIDTTGLPFTRWWENRDNYYFELAPSGFYRGRCLSGKCERTGLWTWNGVDIVLDGEVALNFDGADGSKGVYAVFKDLTLKNVRIDSATHHLRAEMIDVSGQSPGTIDWPLEPDQSIGMSPASP